MNLSDAEIRNYLEKYYKVKNPQIRVNQLMISSFRLGARYKNDS